MPMVCLVNIIQVSLAGPTNSHSYADTMNPVVQLIVHLKENFFQIVLNAFLSAKYRSTRSQTVARILTNQVKSSLPKDITKIWHGL